MSVFAASGQTVVTKVSSQEGLHALLSCERRLLYPTGGRLFSLP